MLEGGKSPSREQEVDLCGVRASLFRSWPRRAWLWACSWAPLHRRGAIEIEYLPAYAPELNPVKYIWGYWKRHEIPNLCAKDVVEFGSRGRVALRRMGRCPGLVASFWKQAELPL